MKNFCLKYLQTNHFRIFSCKKYAHFDKILQEGKLGICSQECVIIGYPEDIKGYKLWNVNENNFFISRNVKFHETAFPLRRNHPQMKKMSLFSA